MQHHWKLQHITVRHLLPVAAPCPEQDAQAPARFYGGSWTFWSQAHNESTAEEEQANVSGEKLLGTAQWILTQVLLWDQGDPSGVLDNEHGMEGVTRQTQKRFSWRRLVSLLLLLLVQSVWWINKKPPVLTVRCRARAQLSSGEQRGAARAGIVLLLACKVGRQHARCQLRQKCLP